MTKEDFANKISGRAFDEELLSAIEVDLAIKHNLLVIAGQEHEFVELFGIINDLVPTDCSSSFYLYKNSVKNTIEVLTESDLKLILKNLETIGLQGHFKYAEIKSIWNPSPFEIAWKFETKLPNAKYVLVEGEDVFCVGIVIEKSEIERFLAV